jgi:hypothetical protein
MQLAVKHSASYSSEDQRYIYYCEIHRDPEDLDPSAAILNEMYLDGVAYGEVSDLTKTMCEALAAAGAYKVNVTFRLIEFSYFDSNLVDWPRVKHTLETCLRSTLGHDLELPDLSPLRQDSQTPR